MNENLVAHFSSQAEHDGNEEKENSKRRRLDPQKCVFRESDRQSRQNDQDRQNRHRQKAKKNQES